MMSHPRHFLKLLDFSATEIHEFLETAHTLKTERQRGEEFPRLQGKALVLLFEKDSTRTRCAFEVSAIHQGAQCSYLGSSGSHMGKKETVADTARVLGRMYDGIAYRGFAQETVEELARYAGVPVFNALTDEFHPTQVLADFLTMSEHCEKPLGEQSLTYLGDGSNNMANSLMVGAAKLGLDFRLASPHGLRPEPKLVAVCEELSKKSGARIQFFEDAKEAVLGADFLTTDVWVSMGQSEELWAERIEALRPFRVTSELFVATENSQARFLHCLPAFHDDRTEVGRKIHEKFGLNGIEVTDEVFESSRSVVFDQAENRLHTIKALLVTSLA